MPKVLLVEDDNNLREIFQMRLQAEGYVTTVAADGEEGLVTAMKTKPDLIIADVMMPKLSGFEMLESLRATPEMKNAKVIMMTALGQAEDQARGERLGVVKYLVKSQVTLEDFARVVKEVLGPGNPADVKAAQQVSSSSNNNQQGSENSMQNDPTANNPMPADSPAPGGGTPADNGSAPAGMPSDSGQQSTADEQAQVQGQVNDAMSSAPAGDTPAAPSEPAAPASDTSAPMPPTSSEPPAGAPQPPTDSGQPGSSSTGSPTDPMSNAL